MLGRRPRILVLWVALVLVAAAPAAADAPWSEPLVVAPSGVPVAAFFSRSGTPVVVIAVPGRRTAVIAPGRWSRALTGGPVAAVAAAGGGVHILLSTRRSVQVVTLGETGRVTARMRAPATGFAYAGAVSPEGHAVSSHFTEQRGRAAIEVQARRAGRPFRRPEVIVTPRGAESQVAVSAAGAMAVVVEQPRRDRFDVRLGSTRHGLRRRVLLGTNDQFLRASEVAFNAAGGLIVAYRMENIGEVGTTAGGERFEIRVATLASRAPRFGREEVLDSGGSLEPGPGDLDLAVTSSGRAAIAWTGGADDLTLRAAVLADPPVTSTLDGGSLGDLSAGSDGEFLLAWSRGRGDLVAAMLAPGSTSWAPPEVIARGRIAGPVVSAQEGGTGRALVAWREEGGPVVLSSRS